LIGTGGIGRVFSCRVVCTIGTSPSIASLANNSNRLLKAFWNEMLQPLGLDIPYQRFCRRRAYSIRDESGRIKSEICEKVPRPPAL
jgi:hypothetical protein